MTTHTAKRPRNWNCVKARIIERFQTISALAGIVGCHPNAIRGAVEGRCNKVRGKLEKMKLV